METLYIKKEKFRELEKYGGTFLIKGDGDKYQLSMKEDTLWVDIPEYDDCEIRIEYTNYQPISCDDLYELARFIYQLTIDDMIETPEKVKLMQEQNQKEFEEFIKTDTLGMKLFPSRKPFDELKLEFFPIQKDKE